MWFKNVVKFVRSVIKMAHEKVFGICENKCAVEIDPKIDTGWITLVQKDVSGVYEGVIKVMKDIEYRRIGKFIYFRGVFGVTRAHAAESRSFALPEEIKACIGDFYDFFGSVGISTTSREVTSVSRYTIDNGYGGLTLREIPTQYGINNGATNTTRINCVVPVDE